jgi:hypothetical protein
VPQGLNRVDLRRPARWDHHQQPIRSTNTDAATPTALADEMTPMADK